MRDSSLERPIPRFKVSVKQAWLNGSAATEGWPQFINIPSKVGQVAAMRVLARERRARDQSDSTLIAAVCPGMIDTDASRPWFDTTNAQTPAAAAHALLDLALAPNPDEALYGELVRFGAVVPWHAHGRSIAARVRRDIS